MSLAVGGGKKSNAASGILGFNDQLLKVDWYCKLDLFL
jgi:hypothetical protein